MIDLRGKNTIVTGGGSGIGRGISRVFAEAGAHVHVVDKNGSDAAETSSSLSGTGEFTSEPVDVTDVVTVQSVVSRSISEFGKIDILVNNAGIVGAQNWWQRDIPNDADWHDVHEVNVRGMVRMSESVSQHMKNRRYGKIINISSNNSVQAFPLMAAYNTSKAGVNMLTKVLALEWAPYNICVNGIGPGDYDTQMTHETWIDPVARKRHISGIPLGREGDLRELGVLAVYLSSAASDYMTGQICYMDGGLTAK